MQSMRKGQIPTTIRLVGVFALGLACALGCTPLCAAAAATDHDAVSARANAARARCAVSFPHELTLAQALAYARHHNHELIVQSLERDRVMTQELAANIWPNPEVSYHLNNIVLGRGNDQERDLKPKPFSQLIHAAELTQVLDVVAKRRARLAVARAHSDAAKLLYVDAQRELTLAVRLAYVQVLRAQAQLRVAQGTLGYWSETLQIFERRHALGDLAALEVDKIALERTRAELLLLAAEEARQNARHALAALLALGGGECLPDTLSDALELPGVAADGALGPDDVDALTACALAARPDVLALGAQMRAATRARALARREVYPDVELSVQYTRSHFQISGDNPHAFGFGVGVPLPVFDRQRAGRRDARLAHRQSEEAQRELGVRIAQEVRDALAAYTRAHRGLGALATGTTLQRAERARDAAQRAQRSGARSLLDVLDAQRTYLALESDALEQQYAAHEAQIRLLYATASDTHETSQSP